MAVLLAPTTFSLFWFAVFGGTGLYQEMFGVEGLGQVVREDVTTALFALFDRLPLSSLLAGTAVALVFIFLVTSVDSATFVLGMLTSGGSMDPPRSRKLAWGITLALMSGALMLTGNVPAIRAVAILGAIPFTFILLIQVAALLRALSEDSKELDH